MEAQKPFSAAHTCQREKLPRVAISEQPSRLRHASASSRHPHPMKAASPSASVNEAITSHGSHQAVSLGQPMKVAATCRLLNAHARHSPSKPATRACRLQIRSPTRDVMAGLLCFRHVSLFVQKKCHFITSPNARF